MKRDFYRFGPGAAALDRDPDEFAFRDAQQKNLSAALLEEREVREAINSMRRRLSAVSRERARIQRWFAANPQ